MKVLVVPDKFKGCLTSLEAASLIGETFKNRGFEVITSALADGGGGTVDAIISALGGQKKSLSVKDPLGRSIESFWGLLEDKKEAVIEMAAASGLHLLSNTERNPLKTSTYGTGQLVKAAMEEGVKKIIVGVGDSVTNDGGMGVAIALGARFIDENISDLESIGEDLAKIRDIDLSDLDKRLTDTEILVAVDVENHFYGPEGAAFIYAPQKGADEDQVKELDAGLRNLAAVVERKIFLDLQQVRGAGAAGGLAGGLVAFLNAKITPGTKLISDLLGLEEKVRQSELIVTGEGCVDKQTLYGKAPSGVLELAKKANKKVVMISGQLGIGWEKVEEAGAKVYPLAKDETEVEACIKTPKPAIEKVVEKIISEI